MHHDAKDLEELLDQLGEAADTDDCHIKVEAMLNAVGVRSFAPLLLLIGLIIISPLSGIPALPTISATIVLLISFQLLIGRKSFWLPSWILTRSLSRKSLLKAVKWLRWPARCVDGLIKQRMTFLVSGHAIKLVALLCLLIASCMPFLELTPFSSSAAGAALAAFGLAMISGDGLLALIAYLTTGFTIYLPISFLLL